MDHAAMRERFASSPVAHLATVDGDGHPHLVPIVFAVDGDVIFFAIDSKPKRTRDLRRLRNIAGNPNVAVLVDHYDADWEKLWWVRADGAAHVLEPGPGADRAIALLVERYPQYQQLLPTGPVIAIAVARWTGWAFVSD